MNRRVALVKTVVAGASLMATAAAPLGLLMGNHGRVGYLEYQENGIPFHGSTDPQSKFFDPWHRRVEVLLDGVRPPRLLIKEYDVREGWILAIEKRQSDPPNIIEASWWPAPQKYHGRVEAKPR